MRMYPLPLTVARDTLRIHFGVLYALMMVTLVYRAAAADSDLPSPTVLWSVQTEGPVRGGVLVDGNRVIFGSTDGTLYAVDADTGRGLWTFDTGAAISLRPALANGNVFVASRDGSLFAVSAETGEQQWVFPMGPDRPYAWGFDAYLSSPNVVEGVLYLGSGDGHVYAIDATSGTERWRFDAGARIRSSPVFGNGLIVIGTMKGVVYALDAQTGRPHWQFDTEGARLNPIDFGFDRQAVVSSAVISDGFVVIGGRDGFLYGLDAESGAEQWRVDHEMSWIIGTPVVKDGIVYTGTSDGAFVQAVDLETGEERWRHHTPGIVWSSPAIDDHHLYVGIGDGSVLALNRASGEVVHRFHTGAGVYSSLVLADHVLYVGSDDGRMYALTGMTPPARVQIDQAVYWEERPAYKWFRNGIDRAIRDIFAAAGYQIVDGEGLAAFMQEHLDSGVLSVIVFATNTVPPTVIDADTSAAALFRQYLDVGRVVWLGSTPLSYLQDPETGTTLGLDYSVAERVIGVQYGGPDTRGMGGFYRAAPTEEGLRWGLTGWWVTRNGVEPVQVTSVLALDEYGKASLWYKQYGGPEGTGLLQLWADRDTPGYLKPLLSISEYGLEGQNP